MQLRSNEAIDISDRVLRVLKNSSTKISRAEIMAAANISYEQLRRALRKLIGNGEVLWDSNRNPKGHEDRRYWHKDVIPITIDLNVSDCA
jgi:predicted transcriptional regulator